MALGLASHAQAQVSPIVITEFSYNSPELIDTLEFVEIYNNSNTTIDISGYTLTLTNDLRFTYPNGSSLGPYELSVIAARGVGFQNIYNLPFTPHEWTSGPVLSNTTGHIVIKDANNVTVDSVAYLKSDLATGTDGRGYSAVLCNKSADNNDMSNWSASTTLVYNTNGDSMRVYNYYLYGSPGALECGFPIISNAPSNDECTGAIMLTVGETCTPIVGSYENATESMVKCSGSVANDVWYSFVATTANLKIDINNPTEDIIFEVFSGDCNALTSMYCVDMTYDGSEVLYTNRYEVGETYYIRVYNYDGSNSNNTFEICITELPIVAAPSNDECANATELIPALTCTPIAGTLNGATQSMPENDCETYDGYAIDVWYSFVATAPTASVLVTGDMAFDAIIEAFAGSCGNLVSIDCVDDTYPRTATPINVTETLNLSNLTVGETYYIRVYEIASAFLNLTDFNICLVGQPPVQVCDTTNLILTLDGCNNNHTVTTVSGGLAPYTYAWSTGATTQNVTDLVIGETYTVSVTDANACTASLTFEQTICNGINEVANGFNMNLYPNPANHKATLALNMNEEIDLTIQLVNINGQILSSEVVFGKGSMAFDLNINHLPTGVYFVKVASKNGLAIQQLIIAK